MRTDAYNC